MKVSRLSRGEMAAAAKQQAMKIGAQLLLYGRYRINNFQRRWYY